MSVISPFYGTIITQIENEINNAPPWFVNDPGSSQSDMVAAVVQTLAKKLEIPRSSDEALADAMIRAAGVAVQAAALLRSRTRGSVAQSQPMTITHEGVTYTRG